MRSPFATLAALPFLLMQEGSIEVGECTHPCVLQTSFKVPSYVTKLWMVIQKTKSVRENINHAGVVSPLWEYVSCAGDCPCTWQWKRWLHQ